MPLDDVLEQHFPGSLAIPELIEKSRAELGAQGYDADNTLACVAVCRDELTHDFRAAVTAAWGEAFSLGSLGGMVLCGRSGFAAARGHAPDRHGRPHYVFFGLSHIGLLEDGTIGAVVRPDREETTSACGALVGLSEQLLLGERPSGIDPDDLEQSHLAARLLEGVETDRAPDLVALTRRAAEVITADIHRLLADVFDPHAEDWAVYGGVLIHLPGRHDRVWLLP